MTHVVDDRVDAGGGAPFALEALALGRSFGDVDAVRAVTFGVRRGEVVGFLGHNGAGKTTTLRMLAGILEPTHGRALVDGHVASTRAARARVGFLPEHPPQTPELTVEEQLLFVAGLRNVDVADVERVMSRCDLGEHRRKITATLSRGTRQRVGLAQALLGDPPVVLLDEPTAGLDPAQAARVRALIGALGTDHAVVFSSHVLSEVQAVCSRVLLMRRGELAGDTNLGQLRAQGESLERVVLQALEGGA